MRWRLQLYPLRREGGAGLRLPTFDDADDPPPTRRKAPRKL